MPKYYCDYCRSYLTHDSMSVRKSHLMGKNHIKYYCDYYEEQAKQLNMWDQSELPYELTMDDIYRGIPRSETLKAVEEDEQEDAIAAREQDTTSSSSAAVPSYDNNIIIRNQFIPPPPPLPNLPNPPPSVYHYDLKVQKNKIIEYIREFQDKDKI